MSRLRFLEGSLYMGSPIIYEATSVAEPVDGEVTFHRVIMTVTIGGRKFELSQPVSGGGQTVLFDVAKVFQAATDGYEYEPVYEDDLDIVDGKKEYPVYTADIQVHDVWMRGGVLVDPAPNNASVSETIRCYAFKGAATDLERREGQVTYTFSSKPKTGELVFATDCVMTGTVDMVSDQPFAAQPATRLLPIAADAEGQVQTGDGRSVFVVPRSTDSMLFQFVNAKGVCETIRAFGKKKLSVHGETENHIISRQETYSQFSRSVTIKKASRTELELTSGFVTPEWAEWWAYEFAHAEHHWVWLHGRWVPCAVTVNDSLTVIDANKSEMCSVSFTCIPDVTGRV